MPKKNKWATIILSALPGVGHMYLGWKNRGFLFMLTFFLSIVISDWIGSRLSFIPIVIWFYSLFDALQCYDAALFPPQYRHDDWHWIFKKQRWVGIGLIVVGGLILLNKMALPVMVWYLGYEKIQMLRVSLVALLLIAGGIRLAWGKPVSPPSLPENNECTGSPVSPEETAAAPAECSMLSEDQQQPQKEA